MTKDRFFQIAAEEGYPDPQSAWDARPDWVDNAEDETIRTILSATVALLGSPEFNKIVEDRVQEIKAHKKASLN